MDDGEAADDPGSASAGGLDPAAVFSLLGNEHRVAILQGLLELQAGAGEYPASFTRLQEQAGIEVSSQFSYHLDELTGHFLRQTPDGYEFRYAGWAVVTAILAGSYTRRGEFDPVALDAACPLCDADGLRAAYQDEWVELACGDCERTLVRYPFPPGAQEHRDRAAFLDAFDEHVRTHVRLATAGVCPACYGPMASSVAGADSVAPERLLRFDCERCGNTLRPNTGLLVVDHRDVESFLGPEAAGARFWTRDWCVAEDATAVVASDPWRAVVRIESGDDALDVEIDSNGSVTEARRSGADS